MQHSDERPPTSGRPSLLSLDQQAEADRHRILSGLDNKPAATTAGQEKNRRGIYTWIAAGAAVLVLSAGAGMWLVSEGEKEIVLAGTAPLPATPAPAAALATEAPPMRGTADDVSTAAILDTAPVIGAKPGADGGKKQDDDELTRMFDQGALAPAGKGVTPVAVKAAPRPAPPRAAKPRPVAKAVKKPAAAADGHGAYNVAPRPRPVVAGAAKKKAAAPAAPVDSDVALLAALVAHSKATAPKSSSGVAAALKQCKSLGSAAEAKQCRTRVCAGNKGEAECKAPK